MILHSSSSALRILHERGCGAWGFPVPRLARHDPCEVGTPLIPWPPWSRAKPSLPPMSVARCTCSFLPLASSADGHRKKSHPRSSIPLNGFSIPASASYLSSCHHFGLLAVYPVMPTWWWSVLCFSRSVNISFLAFASLVLIFFDELLPDMMLDEVVVLRWCLPFLHIVLIEFWPQAVKRFAHNNHCMPLAKIFIELVWWIFESLLHVAAHFILEVYRDFPPIHISDWHMLSN